MQKFMLSLSPAQKSLLQAVFFVIICVLTGGFFLCARAMFISNVDTPEHTLIPLTTVLITLASFLDSLFLAKIFKEKGFLIGGRVGGIFRRLIVLLSLYYGNFAVSGILITKVSAVLFAGILGGILGVNSF